MIGYLVLASEENAVLTYPGVSDRLNEKRLAEHFAMKTPTPGSTFFADVKELLPAHVLIVKPDRFWSRRYWKLEGKVRLRRASDAEYAEEFLSLLQDSVKCRLRSVTRPAIMMSGGLDSGSAAALAARELAGRSPGRALACHFVGL